ncbi:MAG: GNAT family N-acetyltransferase [Rhizobium sp.]
MTEDLIQTGKYKAIVVLDYDPAWPAEFEQIKSKLSGLLDEMVADIAHIGSTSVPGLCAKPKIDVDVVLKSEALIPQGIEKLKLAGYTYHGNKYNDGMWAFTTGRGSFGERVYLCASGTPTHQKPLFFRDHLRAHPEDAATYGALKQRLASETDNDWDYYTGNKGLFVASIVKKAAASRIRTITEHKARIVQETLNDLPKWFGIPASIAAYMQKAEALPMLACLAPDGTAIGFLSVNLTSKFAAEVYVMGVKAGWHRLGVGQALIAAAKEQAVSINARFLTVKTIAASKSDENYAATRAFYESVGFLPVEESPTLWDRGNPCLFMILPLETRA